MDFLQTALFNKDVFTTIIVVGLVIGTILPLIKGMIKDLIQAIGKLEKTMKVGFIDIQTKMGNTVMNEDQTVSLLLRSMSFVSQGKLQYIKQIMIFNHIAGRREEIKFKIKTELEERSKDYINEFKQYITPIGDLSVWIENNFTQSDFDEFVEQIVNIVYSNKYETHMHKDFIIELKTNEIATLMKSLQAKLAHKLKEDMRNFK